MVINMNLERVDTIIHLFKMFFILICTIYTFLKITNNKISNIKNIILSIIYVIILSVLSIWIRYKFNYLISIICALLLLSLLCSKIVKGSIGYTILGIVISNSFNYILYFISLIAVFVFNLIYAVKNDFINLGLIILIHLILLYKMINIKKLKNGISFLKNDSKDDYFDLIILNISINIMLSSIIISYINVDFSKSIFIGFIILIVVMIITIQKSFQLYYKHKLLIKELDETKAELDRAKKNIEKLESENLNISKKNHSLVHKQKALEHKIDKLMLNEETAEELDVKNKLENLSKEMYTKPAIVELAKTEITEIDDMLDCLKSECEENDIDFNLQLNEDIHYMVNNLVSKDELATLIADHIRDAIIAIKHSENINRSILVRLGKIDEYFGLYIYDTGIEFEKETLENIGKRPYTTHKDEGGTGLGFMNTFETLKRHKASLIIEEIGKPCKDNFTKIIKIRFDEKDEFKVISYKEN